MSSRERRKTLQVRRKRRRLIDKSCSCGIIKPMTKDYILNAFNALAVADAVGNPLEFGNPTPGDVLAVAYGEPQLFITDDTQMSLFGMVGITEAYRRHGTPTVQQVCVALRHAYVDWYQTQMYEGGTSWLSKEPLMHKRQAPGNTCLSALHNLSKGKEVSNDSKGCGVVMRLLPFAILQSEDAALAENAATLSGHLTHHHPEVRESVLRYMGVAWALKSGASVPRAERTVPEYGAGWTSMECFEMGYAAFTRAEDYIDMLVQAIAHPGDSDSVAAVAGSLWGVAGKPTPAELVAKLVERELIERVVSDYVSVMENHNGDK